ncbi:MAG: DEAD/DEAH box helicase family protein [Actinomycetaceae bacterium]|nr:DEAD/DEAH box helicase family protein [Actinomycetaceae bacterium]
MYKTQHQGALIGSSTEGEGVCLRDYQNEAVERLFSYLADNKDGSPLLCLPTGTGKSLIIAAVLARLRSVGKRAVVLSHSKEIITQDANAFQRYCYGVDYGICCAGLGRRDMDKDITFATIASAYGVAKRDEHAFGKIDCLIVDEAHRVSTRKQAIYQQFIARKKVDNPEMTVIGLTATPWRLGSGLLTDKPKVGARIFTDIVWDVTQGDYYNKFVQQGYLAPLVPPATHFSLDTSKLKVDKTRGDFREGDIETLFTEQRGLIPALEEAIERGQGRKKWLVFTASVSLAQQTCDALNSMGVRSCVVHGNMSTHERDAVIDGFRNDPDVRAIVNCEVLTTGFDVPNIDLLLMLRPTASPGLWIQMLGRGTRPAPGKKDCLVLDFAQNVQRLGTINRPNLEKNLTSGEGCVWECDANCETEKDGVCHAFNSSHDLTCQRPGCHGVHPKHRVECVSCGAINLNSHEVTHCWSCSAELPAAKDEEETYNPREAPELTETAEESNIQSDDFGDVEDEYRVMFVRRVTYSKHYKAGDRNNTPTLKVVYSGVDQFGERVPDVRRWIALESTNDFARAAAIEAWRQHGGGLPIPESVDEALLRIPHSSSFIHPASISYEPDPNNPFFTRVKAVVPPAKGERNPEFVVYGAQNGRRFYSPGSSGRERWSGSKEHRSYNSHAQKQNSYPAQYNLPKSKAKPVEYGSDGTRLMTETEDAAFVEAMGALRYVFCDVDAARKLLAE